MSAYIIVDVTPTNPEKMQEYAAAAGSTIEAHGGKFLAKGPVEALHGDTPFKMKAVIEFPDREKATAWYNSPEYQALIETRNEGMDSQFHLIG